MNERLRAITFGVAAVVIFMLLTSLVIALFIYFGDVTNSTLRWTTFITSVLILMVGGLIGGKMTMDKGWMTGVLIGAVYVFGILIYQFLANDQWVHHNQTLYFAIFLLASTIGSMVGVNFRKTA
ncbi:TIGR04086 family membrane protein [Halalkalibacillus sediminis]|uniref:TIGR04086 family membrane protein n=1 Tax=Halalkalibacillus sediminis TaxID=2018042 RepID=A0A2I0QYC1_9BACI|nr:TIGR04086 family membrane protein [Halalkalibacillus sediminis]PKR79100.1 TIGR04086 family membrane protein [Halalkalibacillus sediminis]